MKDVGLMAYKNGDISAPNDFPFCCKRFFNLLSSIFGCTGSILCPLSYWKPNQEKAWIAVGKIHLTLPPTNSFFSRKGSLPSYLFCTNALRWTFYRTILHRDFTGKRVVRMKLFLTNLQLHWFSTRYGEGLDKGFFMSYICRWKT